MYTDTARKKLDNILSAFEEYIDSQEIINDVISSPENKTHIPDSAALTEYEIARNI